MNEVEQYLKGLDMANKDTDKKVVDLARLLEQEQMLVNLGSHTDTTTVWVSIHRTVLDAAVEVLSELRDDIKAARPETVNDGRFWDYGQKLESD